VTGKILISVNVSRAKHVAAINLTQHERNQALLLVLFQRLANRLSSKGVMVLLESRQRPPLETQDLCGLRYIEEYVPVNDRRVSFRKARMLVSRRFAHLDPDTMRLRAPVHDQLGVILVPDSIIDITIRVVNPRSQLVGLDRCVGVSIQAQAVLLVDFGCTSHAEHAETSFSGSYRSDDGRLGRSPLINNQSQRIRQTRVLVAAHSPQSDMRGEKV
jgi:hypothetical protein